MGVLIHRTLAALAPPLSSLPQHSDGSPRTMVGSPFRGAIRSRQYLTYTVRERSFWQVPRPDNEPLSQRLSLCSRTFELPQNSRLRGKTEEILPAFSGSYCSRRLNWEAAASSQFHCARWCPNFLQAYFSVSLWLSREGTTPQLSSIVYRSSVSLVKN